jgi:hypothetical protein
MRSFRKEQAMCRVNIPLWLVLGLLSLVFVAIASPTACAAVTNGQVDNFESGAANWTNGALATDPVVVLGGPGGAADHFLQITATGAAGAGGKLIAYNRSQWLGNYTSAGVTAFAMDLENLGSTPLDIRLALKQSTTKTSPGYATTNAFSLAVGSGWQHAVFSLDSSALTEIGVPAPTLSSILGNLGELRILSSAVPSLDGDVIAAKLGVDNITAVPEPAMLLLVVLSGLCLLARHWWRCRAA